MEQRIILFRAYDPDDNEMYFPDVISFTKEGAKPLRLCKDGNRAYKSHVLMQLTGLTDNNGVKIFEDDLRKNESGQLIRIYRVAGGFAIKAPYWATDLSDLSYSDELILQPLSDVQTAQWVCESTTAAGNIYDKTKHT